MRRRLRRQRHDPLVGVCAQSLGGGHTDQGCFGCELWELKYLVALRVVCPISHHIHLPHFPLCQDRVRQGLNLKRCP
jgi:hypothetical protein